MNPLTLPSDLQDEAPARNEGARKKSKTNNATTGDLRREAARKNTSTNASSQSSQASRAAPVTRPSSHSRKLSFLVNKYYICSPVFKDAEQLFEDNDDLEVVQHDNDDEQMNDFEDDPPAPTSEIDESGISGVDDLDQDEDEDEDEEEDGAISKVVMTNRVADSEYMRRFRQLLIIVASEQAKTRTAKADDEEGPKRPTNKSLDPSVRHYIKRAEVYFRAEIANTNAFPDVHEENEFILDGVDRACNEDEGVSIRLKASHEKLVCFFVVFVLSFTMRL